MIRRLRLVALLPLFLFAVPAVAEEVVVEGSAVIRNGDLGEDREQATRRAMARAAEFRQARVSSQALVQAGVATETVQVSATACTGRVDVLDEKVLADELTVILRVALPENGECRQQCTTAYVNRMVVTAFALEYPEQKLPGEQLRISAVTAVELAKKLVRRGRLLAEYEASAYPYVSPSRAPVLRTAPDDAESPLAGLARRFRGQYILSGVYRDLGVSGSIFTADRRRTIQIEAFLHDGANGEVLARRSFTREVRGDLELTSRHSVGSAAFYGTDFGVAWGGALDAIAAWTEEHVACLPFIARVLKVSGDKLQVDAGSESGLSVGDTLSLHNWRDPPVWGVTGTPLGREKSTRTQAVVRTVYPKFSILEMQTPPANLQVRPGDVLYAQ